MKYTQHFDFPERRLTAHRYDGNAGRHCFEVYGVQRYTYFYILRDDSTRRWIARVYDRNLGLFVLVGLNDYRTARGAIIAAVRWINNRINYSEDAYNG